MYKLNFLDAKRNPNALLQPLKPVSESALQGRDSKAVEAANGEEDEKGPTYPYNAWPKINHNARGPGISAYVSLERLFGSVSHGFSERSR